MFRPQIRYAPNWHNQTNRNYVNYEVLAQKCSIAMNEQFLHSDKEKIIQSESSKFLCNVLYVNLFVARILLMKNGCPSNVDFINENWYVLLRKRETLTCLLKTTQ